MRAVRVSNWHSGRCEPPEKPEKFLHTSCDGRRKPAHAAVHCVVLKDMTMARSSPFLRTPVRDLSPLRDALTMIRNDLQRVPGFEATSAALTKALEELALAEHLRQPIPLAVRAWTRPARPN
jgi:hypothetical protein